MKLASQPQRLLREVGQEGGGEEGDMTPSFNRLNRHNDLLFNTPLGR